MFPTLHMPEMGYKEMCIYVSFLVHKLMDQVLGKIKKDNWVIERANSEHAKEHMLQRVNFFKIFK